MYKRDSKTLLRIQVVFMCQFLVVYQFNNNRICLIKPAYTINDV